jgi:hypothetical protein
MTSQRDQQTNKKKQNKNKKTPLFQLSLLHASSDLNQIWYAIREFPGLSANPHTFFDPTHSYGARGPKRGTF